MNNGLTGMVPTALKELTELQDLHLSGTALTGSLSLVFCMGDFNITNFEADCAGGDQTEVQCSCCTVCCERIDDEPYYCGSNTFAPSYRRNYFEEVVASYYPDSAYVFVEDTDQYDALELLANSDPVLVPVPDDTLDSKYLLLQRYVLVVLYLATTGNDWYNGKWLEDQAGLTTCDWSGVTCSDGNSIDILDGTYSTVKTEAVICPIESHSLLYCFQNSAKQQP
jgi:hypothetical protein